MSVKQESTTVTRYAQWMVAVDGSTAPAEMGSLWVKTATLALVSWHTMCVEELEPDILWESAG